MVGKLKISSQAEAVRQLFMALEKDAKQIKTCWLCRSQLPQLKLANQGHLTGNHERGCPFEELAAAGEQCIKVRKDEPGIRQAAERVLAEKIEHLFATMTKKNAPICPFPICEYPFDGHRLECPLSALRKPRKQA